MVLVNLNNELPNSCQELLQHQIIMILMIRMVLMILMIIIYNALRV